MNDIKSMDIIRRLCSPELLEAIRGASVEDLEFEENAVTSHSMSGDIKTGYRLREVAGVSVPKGKFIVYIRNDGRKGRHWYVVNWLHRKNLDDEGEQPWPHYYSGPSEEEAKQEILRELKLLLE